ncbi:hypothetical protein OG429_02640 [Streptomyces sp. NBC_00190]|uniref:hypothetical protein n=1 Tax=unclassified Streptomyces TaxID=2593676 RepID=UPI002E2A5D2C|nr:hypothetical protein [Streptomyces sp. NBC_00190]WSZ38314.1 hypothetical protein OG239_05650 [Streptomyces sp. NBC_00868]
MRGAPLPVLRAGATRGSLVRDTPAGRLSFAASGAAPLPAAARHWPAKTPALFIAYR